MEVEGPCAVITAGWQEREMEMDELVAGIDREVINLRLHHRAEEFFEADTIFRDAHRGHQQRMRQLQEIYRIRLSHTLACVHQLTGNLDNWPEDVVLAEIEDALAMVRELDRHHLGHMRNLQEAFLEEWQPYARPALKEHHLELTDTLYRCPAVLIAGGHVAVLLNRLRLLGLEGPIREKTVLASSAGAMVLGEQVVLFHDSPPQGPGYAEVFEAGLGLFDDLVPLPHARNRLLLDNPTRVSIFARRFEAASCLTLDDGARVDRVDGRWHPRQNIHRLKSDGTVEELA